MERFTFKDLPSDRWLYGFIGRPGVGKTSLIRRCLNDHPEICGMVRSFTTRPKRSDDEEREYEHITLEQLDDYHSTGEVTWCQEAHGHYYGNLNKHFEDALYRYRYSFIALTPETLPQAWAKLPQDIQRYFYLIAASESVFKDRMEMRGDSPASIEYRLETSRDWEKYMEQLLKLGDMPIIKIVSGDKEELYQTFYQYLPA